MNESIRDIKNDLINFFVNEEHDKNMVLSLRIRLGYFSLEVSYNGISEVNNKYNEKHPHLISATKDESEFVMFVFRPALHEDVCAISLCCVKKDKIYDFVSEHGEVMIPMKQFRGKVGDEMISSSLNFRHGTISPLLKPSTSGPGFDIVKFKRSFK